MPYILAVGVDPLAPMSLGAFFAVIGVIITWVLFAIAIWRLRGDIRKADQDANETMAKIAREQCRSWHFEPEQQSAFERKVDTRAKLLIDDEFTKRSSSFVDSKEFGRAEAEILRRLKENDNAIKANTAAIAAQGAQIARDVSQAVSMQLAAFLNRRIIGPGPTGGGNNEG